MILSCEFAMEDHVMWEPLPVEVRNRLRVDNPHLPVEREHASWGEYVEAIEQYRELADDYDGHGAIAPSSEVIDSGVTLVRDIIDIAVPSYCVPGPNGSVNLAWELDDESSVTVEVVDANHAEVILVDVDGREHRVWAIKRFDAEEKHYRDDLNRLNKMCEAARTSGMTVGGYTAPPRLNDDGSLTNEQEVAG